MTEWRHTSGRTRLPVCLMQVEWAKGARLARALRLSDEERRELTLSNVKIQLLMMMSDAGRLKYLSQHNNKPERVQQ